MVAGMGTQKHLVVRIVPRLIDEVEQWVGSALQTPGLPSEKEIFDNSIGPLLEQVRNDATQQIATLAENRLGIARPSPAFVRPHAIWGHLAGVPVAQRNQRHHGGALADGRHQVYELRDKFEAEAGQMKNPPDLRQFYAAVDLYYPGHRGGAAGRLEQAGHPAEAADPGRNGKSAETPEEVDELVTAS